MMPPIAVAVPIYMMYRELGLYDTRIGMILLYTAVNVSLAVWLLKGFIDEIPREYEEAALVDGYTRLQAFRKAVLPQAVDRHRGDRDLLPDLLVERIRLRLLLTSGTRRRCRRSFPSSSARAARTGLRSRRRRRFPAADHDFHGAAAKASPARHHLRGGAPMTMKIEPAKTGASAWRHHSAADPGKRWRPR